MLAEDAHYTALRSRFPHANILGCSTGGQMTPGDVNDQMLTALALDFAQTPLRLASAEVSDPQHSRAAGEVLGRQLAAPDLAGLFILAEHSRARAIYEELARAGILVRVFDYAPTWLRFGLPEPSQFE